jgi:transcriptional regulator NrdR family protein
MVCIYCGGDLAVSNSRPQKSRNQTWRRRPCRDCGAVFTSLESLDLAQALVVAHDGQLQPFDRDRLFVSLYQSLRHRPTATSDARGLTDTVVAHIIRQAANGSVTARTIATQSLNTLQRFDRAAAVHYAAFHRQAVETTPTAAGS